MTFNAGIEAAALKPCPFCGEPPKARWEWPSVFCICCANDDCDVGCETSAVTEQEATNSWNTRPSSSAPVEQREAVAWRYRLRATPNCDWSLTLRDLCWNTALEIEPLYSLPGSSRDEDQAVQHMTRVFAEALDCSEECKPGSCSCRLFAIRALKSGGAK